MEFEVLSTRVSHHLATGRAAEAVDLLKGELQEHQENPEFWEYYASSLLALQRYPEAEGAARAALNLNSERPDAGKFLAFALMRQRRRDEALQTVYWLIETWPEFAEAHYLLGMILVSSVRSADDHMLARQATEHALRLQPGNPEFYHGAALAAQVAGDNRTALAHLQAGLGFDPNHQGLLRFAAEIEHGEQLVGDRGQLLRGMLASDPMNEGLHEDFAETFVEKQGVYRNRFWVFIPLLSCLAAFAGAGNAGRIVMAVVIALVSGAFALWNWTSYKAAAKPLPAGYLRDIRARSPWAFRGLRLYQASWAAGLAGALLACFQSVVLPGAILMLCGVLGGQLAGAWVARDIAGVPKDRQDREARRLFLLRRSGALASGFWMRVLLVFANMMLFAVCASNGSLLGAVPLAAVGLGLLAVALPLIGAQFRLGAAGNIFAYGQALGASSKHRSAALVRGNVGGIYFIGLHLVFGLIATIGAAAMLLLGPAELGASEPLPRQPEHSELKLRQLEDTLEQLRTQQPQIPEMPSFPPLDQP